MKMEEGNKLTNLSLINNLYKQFIFIHIPIGITLIVLFMQKGKQIWIYIFSCFTPQAIILKQQVRIDVHSIQYTCMNYSVNHSPKLP